MRGLLSKTTKRAWRTAFACALASCGLARADEPIASPPPSAAAAPPDLTSLYRDAYTNPNAVCPPGAAGGMASPYGPVDRPLGGVWTNYKRWKFYGGADYIRWQRTGLPRLALTSVSLNLFFDEEEARLAGAQNADGIIPPRNGQALQPGEIRPLFPAKVFPGVNLPAERYTPNDDIMRVNVNEFLVPGQERLSTDAFDVGRVRSGFRPKVGIEFENGDRFDISYFVIEDIQPAQIVDNVAEAGFLMKQISSINPLRFGMFRFGYIDAPFTITQGSRDVELFTAFRGEDVRRFVPPPRHNAMHPHHPYNERPQPTVTNDPTSPLLPPFDPGDDDEGIRSSDIPREPTANDFPGQSYIFEDGELAVATFRSDIQGAEAVYRRPLREWNPKWFTLEALVGFKWINSNERFTFFFADLYNFSRTTAAGVPFPGGGVTQTPNIPQPPFFDPNDAGLADPPDQRGQAAEDTQITIDRKVKNQMFGPQIGLDFRVPIWSYFDLQASSKLGMVMNHLTTSALTFRGDGLIYSNYEKSNNLTSGIWDGQLGVNYQPHPRVKIGGGFEWLHLIRVAGAISNQSTDLSQENRPKNNERVTYTGWYAGAEFKY
jgi:hypothetical protein